MNQKSFRDILDSAAADATSRNTDLWPKIATRLERKSPMMTLRTRPFVALLIVLFILLALSSVAYALSRVLGYIPGFGLVDQSAPLRRLFEPVSQTRDGITVTVKGAILSSDKTAIILSVENIPVDKLSPDGTGSGCELSAQLKLRDGSTNPMSSGTGLVDWGSGYTGRFTFAPLSPNVKDATLLMPCISGALPGALPGNWELPIRFAPVPPDMTVVPVAELKPTPQADDQNPFKLEKVIETENGYIFAGTFRSVGLPQDGLAIQFSQFPVMTDASGENVSFNLANVQLDLPSEETTPGSFPWAFEVSGKQLDWPLTIHVYSVAVEYAAAETSFAFETGPNPQVGQAWDLNLDLELAGIPFKVTQAIRTADGFRFNFESATLFHGVNVTIGDSFEETTGMDDPTHFSSSVKFAGVVPSGKLIVLLTRPVIAVPGNWQLQGMPDHTESVTPVSTQAPQACLTDSAWQANLANPMQIPADLDQRVIVAGPLVESQADTAENYGTFFVNLDGSEKHVLGQGISWASPSPEGSKVVFRGEDGLYIAEVATGVSYRIPNTLPNDDHPLWSPDGTQIAFVRVDEQRLYVISPDGAGLQSLTDGTQLTPLLGWSPDGSALFYDVEEQGGMLLRKLNLASGTITDLFVANTGSEASISPGGNEIAFFDSLDKMNIGLYVSRLDGSNRKLLAQIRLDSQIGQVGAIAPSWTPDGNWLAVSVGNANPNRLATALVNPRTCQVIPIPIPGSIISWIP